MSVAILAYDELAPRARIHSKKTYWPVVSYLELRKMDKTQREVDVEFKSAIDTIKGIKRRLSLSKGHSYN